MRKETFWMNIVLCLILACELGLATSGCAFLTKALPQLSPQASVGLDAGLSALQTILAKNGVATDVITAAQGAIADDTSGATWGQAIRDMLSSLYTNAPGNVLADSAVWAKFTALEKILATIGA